MTVEAVPPAKPEKATPIRPPVVKTAPRFREILLDKDGNAIALGEDGKVYSYAPAVAAWIRFPNRCLDFADVVEMQQAAAAQAAAAAQPTNIVVP